MAAIPHSHWAERSRSPNELLASGMARRLRRRTSSSRSLGRLATTAILLLGLISRPAHAWWDEGHQIVAEIASRHLSTTARAEIEALLADLPEYATMPAAATWADRVAKFDPALAFAFSSHFVNVDKHLTPRELHELCLKKSGCVATGIAWSIEVLRSTRASRSDRAEALRFLIHFVGDAHQPLHAGHGADKGGNDIGRLRLAGFQTDGDPINLHMAWDGGMISLEMQRHGWDWQRYAAELDARIDQEEIARWAAVRRTTGSRSRACSRPRMAICTRMAGRRSASATRSTRPGSPITCRWSSNAYNKAASDSRWCSRRFLNMHTLSISKSAGPALLAAIVDVAEQPEHPGVRRWLAFVGEEIGIEPAPGTDASPTALAAAITEPDARLAALERLLIAAMIVPPLTAARLERLDALARALDRAKEPALADLHNLLAGHHRRLTAALMSRFPPSERIRTAWRRGRLADRWRLAKSMFRLPDAQTAARYRELAQLPEDTLGRTFHDHCRRNEFALPGERGALPETMVFHDMAHALVGAGTDIAGEVHMGGFEAGCLRERGFSMIEFAFLLFNLGAKLPTDAAPAIGQVDVDTLLRGYVDGRNATLDLLAWDPGAEVGEPLSVLRERYRISTMPQRNTHDSVQ